MSTYYITVFIYIACFVCEYEYMKKQLVLILIAFSSYTFSISEEAMEMCSSFKGMAEAIMTNRQDNLDMSKMIEVLMEQDEAIHEIGMAMIVDAYELPSYSSESNKKEAVSEFSNEVYLECFKTFKDQ